MIKIDIISDLHGFYPKLEGGDLLIVAGDLTANDQIEQYIEFNEWLSAQDYKRKIVIAGNHDGYCEIGIPVQTFPGQTKKCVPVLADKAVYLCDSGHEYEGLKIWGSPWTKRFHGMNPNFMAFTVETDKELAEKWALIPDDTDILICHSPSWGLHDKVKTNGIYQNYGVGSPSLTRWISNHVNSLKLFVCGHIHESYGVYDIRKFQDELGDKRTTVHINASHVNERYEPVNKPIRIEL